VKILIIFILLIFNFSCSSEKAGLDKLKELCEKDAGLTIYKTVEADGYYDDTTICHHCWHGLINSPYQYIEFCDFDSDRPPIMYILKDHGCYRLSKVKRDSNQCHIEIDSDINKKAVEPFVSFRDKQCISVESIDKPESELGLFLNIKKDVVIKNDFEISKYHHTIKNNTQKIGELINYSLVVRTIGGAGYSCGSSAITGKRTNEKNPSFHKLFINKVIQHKY